MHAASKIIYNLRARAAGWGSPGSSDRRDATEADQNVFSKISFQTTEKKAPLAYVKNVGARQRCKGEARVCPPGSLRACVRSCRVRRRT